MLPYYLKYRKNTESKNSKLAKKKKKKKNRNKNAFIKMCSV